MKKTLAIVGGGAVGLSSAIHAYNFSKGKINIIILEKMDDLRDFSPEEYVVGLFKGLVTPSK